MTTTVQSRPSVGRTPPRHAVSRRAVRRRWSASWLAAVRLARRDALRHKGASILIMIMVGLPVLFISAASAALATSDITAAESLPVSLGHAQAKIIGQEPGVVVQSFDGTEHITENDQPVEPFPGRSADEPWTPAQLTQLTGGRISAVGYPELFAVRPSGVVRLDALAVTNPAGSGLATLTEGRWPAGVGEVAVTEAGIAEGAPRTGALELRASDGDLKAVQITGVVTAADPSFDPVGLVVDDSWIDDGATREFLVDRDQPVSWSDVQAWNQHGLVVLSRQVVEHPLGATESSELRRTTDDAVGQALVVLVCLGLVLETTLLAGPAFAVSAARRRRSLALIGSNGAEPAQLSRYVLAQGLVLGGVAAVVGAVLGTVSGWVALRVYVVGIGTPGDPPLDFYATITGLVLVVAVAAALVAAAIPARGVARLAVAGTLAGHDQRAAGGRRAPVIGAGLMVVGLGGVAVALVGLDTYAQMYTAGVAAAFLVIGSIPCVPLLLRGIARFLARGPVPLRMAARDAARSRSRSGSAIAAITVAVAVLTIIVIANASDDVQQRRDYVPQRPYGQGSVGAYGYGGGTGADTVQEIRRQHPTWSVLERAHLGSWEVREGRGSAAVVAVVAPGCRADQAIANTDDKGPTGPCTPLGSNSGGSLLVLPAAALAPDLDLTTAQRNVLDAGGLLITDPALMRGPVVRLAAGTYEKPVGEGRKVQRTVDLSAALMTPAQLRTILGDGDPNPLGALMLASAAERAKLPVEVDEWEVVDPGGPISKADEAAVNDHAVVPMSVERGYESGTALLVRVVLAVAGALVAIAALISTALAQVEGQSDLATISALGGGPRFRRWLAGSQAVVVALTGALLGVALGFGPGLAFATTFTTDAGYANGAPLTPPDPVIVIPWPGLGLVVVGVPLAAGLVAAAAVRRSPVMTRRPT